MKLIDMTGIRMPLLGVNKGEPMPFGFGFGDGGTGEVGRNRRFFLYGGPLQQGLFIPVEIDHNPDLFGGASGNLALPSFRGFHGPQDYGEIRIRAR